MAKQRMPWFKVYGDYFDSPSHVALDARAMWVGVVLMRLIRAGCDARDDREPWALLEDGSPVPLAAIARASRWGHQITKRCLEDLQRAGTCARREDGAWGMPKFWEKQETPSERQAQMADERRESHKVYFALDGEHVKIGCSSNPWARVASLREGKATITLRAYTPGNFADERALHDRFSGYRVAGEWYRYDGELRSYVDALPVATRSVATSKRREVRGESDSLRESPPSVPDAKPPDPHVEAAARVLARLNEHLVALGEPGKLTTTSWILALLRQRPDGEAECMTVLDHMAREAREIGTAKHLNPSTPFRPAHFETRLAHARAGAAKRPPSQPSLLSIAEIRQLEAEEDARATR